MTVGFRVWNPHHPCCGGKTTLRCNLHGRVLSPPWDQAEATLEGTLSHIILLLGFLPFVDLLLPISYWFPKCFLNKSLAHESFSQDLFLRNLTIIMTVSFSSYIQLYECRQRVAFNQDGRIQANNMKWERSSILKMYSREWLSNWPSNLS